MKTLTLGTRASALALAQTELTRNALLKAYPEMEIRVETFVTQGDKKLDLNLLPRSSGGGKGLFTRELEEALLDRRVTTIEVGVSEGPNQEALYRRELVARA